MLFKKKNNTLAANFKKKNCCQKRILSNIFFFCQNQSFASFFNLAPETSDVNWMNVILFTTVKVSECKLRPFEHAQSMSKWPAGLGFVGKIINYLCHLLSPFPRGLWKDLEGSSTFLLLMLLMHINRLGFVQSLVWNFTCMLICMLRQLY